MGVLFKNKMRLSLGSFVCLQQVEDRSHIQSSVSRKAGLAVAGMHYLINYMLISSLQLAELTQLQLFLQNTVLSFNTEQE